MRGVLRDLPHDFSLLINTSFDGHLDAYRLLEDIHLPTICVLLNRTASNVKRLLASKGISSNNIHFIDCASRKSNSKLLPEHVNLYDIDLTEISNAVDSLAKSIPGKKVLIFDSLSSLTMHYPPEVISSFMNLFVDRMKLSNVNTIFLSENHYNLNINPDFFDRVLEV